MPFDLRAALTEFHQTIMELSSPLLERIDAVPALQVLQPYRDSLPYLAAALGLLLFLVLARALRRPFSRKKARKKKEESFRAMAMAVPALAPVSVPLSTPVKTPIHGRAVDIAPDFDTLSFFSASAAPAVPRDFSAAALETVSELVPAPQEAAPQRSVALAQDVAAAFPALTESSPVSQPAAGVPIAATAPSIALSDAAAAVSVEPVASAPAPAVRPEVPGPPDPAPASSRVTSLNANFRKIYIVMYIDLELTTNFSALLADVNGRLARKAPTEPLMPTGSGGPEDEIFAHLALAALDDLQTKEPHFESGILPPHGQELCTIFEYALNRLKGSGKLSENTAKQLLQETLDKLRSTPGASS